MTAPAALRVASFNIRNGRAFDGWNSWPCRRRATARTLAALDADVVGLQEVFGFQLRSLLRAVPGYRGGGDGRSAQRAGERCPVLARAGRVRVLALTTRWFGDLPDRPGSRLPGAGFPRIATLATLRLDPAGPDITVANAHLDEKSEANRVRSAEQLASWLDPALPAIVLGDFNATPTDAALSVLRQAGLRPALPPGAGGTTHGFTGRTGRRQIDHILVSEHWTVRAAQVFKLAPGGRLPSDHWPIVADLTLR